MNRISPSIIRQIFILLVIFLLGGLIFAELLPFLSGILGAITIYVLFRKFMITLVRKKWNKSLAASLILVLSFIGILIPVAGVILMIGNKLGNAVKNSEKVFAALKEQLADLEDRIGYDLSSSIDTSAISSWISGNVSNLAGSTFTIIMSIAIMYFILFYMFTARGKMLESLYDYIPIGQSNLKIIGKEVVASVRSNAIGIPLVALAQGIIALIGFLIFGVEDPFFWFVITTIGSMIPFVGTLLGVIPVFILTMSTGTNFQAIGILLYGVIVVGSTDNLVRLFVMKKLDDVHPLITLIGVIIGVPLFGFIGLIFGPLLISLFLLILKIYKEEYGKTISEETVL